MSTALITICKDEADIIRPFLHHSLHHVDEILIADHGSTDGTREILEKEDGPIVISDLSDPGYWQSKYMTELAQAALERGHQWVVAADVDEVWYVGADIDRPVKRLLAGLAPDVQIVRAELYDHIPTVEDADHANPHERIRWRKRERGALPKVACRLHPSLVINPGNHSASYQGTALAVGGLVIRHFSFRSPEQYLRKIKNGSAAYSHTNLPEGTGAHWRMWDGKPDEAILDHFDRWFYSHRPERDDSLIYDPAPVWKGE